MDGEIADVVLTLHEEWVDKLDEAIVRLTEIGLDVASVDRPSGVLEGSIDTSLLASLSRMEPVAYVRKVMEYAVNYPPGDPRDRDGR